MLSQWCMLILALFIFYQKFALLFTRLKEIYLDVMLLSKR